MFDSIVENKDKRGRWVSALLATSLGVHALALGVVLFVDQLRVGPVPEPSVAITFVDLASAPPPPPPPPPPKKKAAPKKVEVKPDQPKPDSPHEMMSPREIPQAVEAKKEEPVDTGSDDGVEGGVEGGVAGGVVAGAQTAPPPPPPEPAKPPPPPPPTFQDVEFVRKRRVEGVEPAYPPAALRNEDEGVVVVKITIGPDGRITDIQVMQSHPAFERTVRDTLAGWKFSPHIVEGRAVSVYTIVKFTFKLQ